MVAKTFRGLVSQKNRCDNLKAASESHDLTMADLVRMNKEVMKLALFNQQSFDRPCLAMDSQSRLPRGVVAFRVFETRRHLRAGRRDSNPNLKQGIVRCTPDGPKSKEGRKQRSARSCRHKVPFRGVSGRLIVARCSPIHTRAT